MTFPLIHMFNRFGPVGIFRWMSVLVVDALFDFYEGVDTRRCIEPESLGVPEHISRYASRYQPTRILPFITIVKNLKLTADTVFVDLGCGKGRILMVASRMGFASVRGVEVSPPCLAILKKNCAGFKKKHPDAIGVEIIAGDVRGWTMQDDETVVFMFNPFDGFVMKDIAQKIRASWERKPRLIRIIYRNPVLHDVIEIYCRPDSVEFFHCCGVEGYKVFTIRAAVK